MPFICPAAAVLDVSHCSMLAAVLLLYYTPLSSALSCILFSKVSLASLPSLLITSDNELDLG